MKKGTIYNYAEEIADWEARGSFLAECYRSKIKEFRSGYNMKLTKVVDEITKVQKLFMEFEPNPDSNKNDAMRIKRDEKGEAIFLPGKNVDQLTSLYNRLMLQDDAESVNTLIKEWEIEEAKAATAALTIVPEAETKKEEPTNA